MLMNLSFTCLVDYDAKNASNPPYIMVNNPMSQPTLHLTNHFQFAELFHSAGLARLDKTFLTYLSKHNAALHSQLLTYRNAPHALAPIETSELLISCARILEDFLAALFHIEEAVAISKIKTIEQNPISIFKKYYVLRRAKKELSRLATFAPYTELNTWLETQLSQSPLQTTDKELAVALLGTHYLDQPETNHTDIEKLVQWCTHVLHNSACATWVSFDIPERLDYTNLVPTQPLPHDKYHRLETPDDTLRLRNGFTLTDPRMNAREVQDQVNYCIYCHDHDGDFCSKGFPVKKGDPSLGLKKNPLDVTMTGCPLDEKISEMNFLKQEGGTLASLAMVMVDNPLCPATGHRICNDCMKACIYQKQEPVNIPQIETRVLIDVLNLPWGVEIYDLLTRWNPLRATQWLMQPYNGLKVMIAGMGPAGFTLAHHLLLDGFAVVGFDGLKIEPLPEALIKQPIYRFEDLKETLDERLMAGFGGVAEYGITVRWDKNFLKLIYISLMRRPYFQVFGNIRFGGSIMVEDAWEMGFDHFALAVGAGLPKALSIPNSLAPGMRQANDFLMALQLGNAAKPSSLTNLEIRLPAVVIGGGLTGVDTATELQAYYIVQVEKMLQRYETLCKERGEETIDTQLDAPSREILAEYVRHGRAVRKERERAKANKETPNFIKLIREWGGVTIAYRRRMQESPAYINNHEELQKALEEGIYYAEGLEPIAVDLNEFGHTETLICHKRIFDKTTNAWMTLNEEVRLPARSILVATGTQPNTAYEFEHRGTFNRLNLQYQHYEDLDGELVVAHGITHCKEPAFGAFTSYHKDHYRVSLIGDTHPVFHGSVVKAIASGMRTYTKISAALKNKLGKEGDETEYQTFAKNMRHAFQAKVLEITRKTANTLELVIQAPLASKHFKPGQFYRLQNYETYAPHLDHTLFQMEPLALTGAECDKKNGVLHFIVTENSASAKLCALLKPGEPVALMGPTGVRAKIPHERETILMVGTATSSAFLRSVGPALKQAGNRILYVGQFATREENYCQDVIENIADVIIWLTKTGELITPHRPQDVSLRGDDVVASMIAYMNGTLINTDNTAPANAPIALHDIDRIYLAGSTDLLRHFQAARQTTLKNYFVKDPKIFASVYGNMQCMLKGVCAQCLQWQIDPETGARTKAVFACSWQDQPLEVIDIDHMDARQFQNRLHEQMNQWWVDYVFAAYEDKVVRS